MCFIYLIITQILNITVYDKKKKTFVNHDENQDWVDSTWMLKLILYYTWNILLECSGYLLPKHSGTEECWRQAQAWI